MKRRILGRRRSIFIWRAPAVLLSSAELLTSAVDLPRSLRRKAMGPLVGPLMSNLPMRVSLVTSVADIRQTMASHRSRRARSAGNTGRKWSSMNSMVAITMSARAMSSVQRLSAAPSSPHSAAACTDSDRPGTVLARLRCARSAALARWLSMVTSTTFMPGDSTWLSAAEMGFGIVKGLQGDDGQAFVPGIEFGVAAGLAANEKRDLAQFLFGLDAPGGGGRRGAGRLGHRNGSRRGLVRAAQVRGRGVFVEFGVAAEHADQVLFQAHHERVHPGVEQHVGALETHLRRVARGEVLHMHRRGNDGARNAQALGDVALHLRAQHQLGLQLGDARLHVEVVVADQRLHAVERGRVAHLARELAAVGAQADHGEAHFLRGDARGGHHMGGVAEHEHALAREVGGI
eukprot:Opistho-1_new@59960